MRFCEICAVTFLQAMSLCVLIVTSHHLYFQMTRIRIRRVCVCVQQLGGLTEHQATVSVCVSVCVPLRLN